MSLTRAWRALGALDAIDVLAKTSRNIDNIDRLKEDGPDTTAWNNSVESAGESIDNSRRDYQEL